MQRIKQNLVLWLILTSTFLIFLFICGLINNEVSFFTNYQSFYERKEVSVYLNGLIIDVNDPSDFFLDKVNENDSLTFNLPEYNTETSTVIVFPDKFLEDLEMVKGSYFTKDDASQSVVIGKDVFASLNNSDQAKKQIMIYGETFTIKGILSKSPFNNSILVNGNVAIKFPRILQNVVQVNISGRSYQQATTQLENFISNLQTKPTYLGEITQQSAGLGIADFSKLFKQYQGLFVQLFLVAILSIGIHYYQRFDSWRLELAIRKMVGANTLQLVSDTFKKFFILTSIAFLSSLAVFLISSQIFIGSFAFSLRSVILATLQVGFIYASLLLLLFLFSFFYVRKVSVSNILLEAEK